MAIEGFRGCLPESCAEPVETLIDSGARAVTRRRKSKCCFSVQSTRGHGCDSMRLLRFGARMGNSSMVPGTIATHFGSSKLAACAA